MSAQSADYADYADSAVDSIVHAAVQLLSIPFKRIWYSYDEEADVLCLNFKKPSHADDSELTDDNIISDIRAGKIGLTAIHSSRRGEELLLDGMGDQG